MNDADSKEALSLLREILAELRYNRAQAPQRVTLAEFCKMLGRSTGWGYQKIAEHRIIPDKSGKPYMVELSQLENFK